MDLTDYQQGLLERLVNAAERQATALEGIQKHLAEGDIAITTGDEVIHVDASVVVTDIEQPAITSISLAVEP